MTLSKAEQAAFDCRTCKDHFALGVESFYVKAMTTAYQRQASPRYIAGLYRGIYHLAGHNAKVLNLFDIAARQE